jgi:hypothetical protein
VKGFQPETGAAVDRLHISGLPKRKLDLVRVKVRTPGGDSINSHQYEKRN